MVSINFLWRRSVVFISKSETSCGHGTSVRAFLAAGIILDLGGRQARSRPRR